MDRTLQSEGFGRDLAGLVLEKVHGVAGMVPEEVVRPAAGLAESVHVGSAEEVGLYIQLLQLQLPGLKPAVQQLVTGIEAASVPTHGDEAGFPLGGYYQFGVRQGICDGDFHHDMFTRTHHLNGLSGMDRRWRCQDDGFNVGPRQALFQTNRPVPNTKFLRNSFRIGSHAPGQRDYFHAINFCQGFQVLHTERTLTRYADPHRHYGTRWLPRNDEIIDLYAFTRLQEQVFRPNAGMMAVSCDSFGYQYSPGTHVRTREPPVPLVADSVRRQWCRRADL